MYEILFDLTASICDRFPGLSPFDIRREKVSEVFLLVKRLNAAEERKQRKEKASKTKQGLARVPASDNWF